MALVRSDFDALESMIQAFLNGAAQMDQTAAALNEIALLIEGGALISEQGARLTGILHDETIPFAQRAQVKYQELAHDLEGVVLHFRDRDEQAQSRFMSE